MVGGGGGDVAEVGRLGRGACSWDLRNFLLVLLSWSQRVRNDNYERRCEGGSIPMESSLIH